MGNKSEKINVMMLATLEALYLCKTTTLAAERLGIGQPSVSWYLKQLRELTGDNLFIRTSKGLEPTDFCTNYYHRAKEILSSLDLLAALKNEAFDPRSAAATFAVSIPFVKSRMLLEGLSINLMSEYPSIEANLLHMEEAEALQHLESGLLDVYIGFSSEKLPKHFSTEKILETEFIVLCSEKSPFFKKGKVSKEEYLETPHIKLAAGLEPSILDTKLKQCGLLQKKLISVPDIASEIILLQKTAFLVIIDKSDAHMMSGSNCKILKTDFSLPQLSLYAVWHTRKKDDPAHKWFREYLQKFCRAYNKGSRSAPA